MERKGTGDRRAFSGLDLAMTGHAALCTRDLPGDRGAGILLINHHLGFVTLLDASGVVLNRGEAIFGRSLSKVQQYPAYVEACAGARASHGLWPASPKEKPIPTGQAFPLP